MTDRDDELGRTIARSLSAGLDTIDQQTLDRLHAARNAALARQRRQPAWSLAEPRMGSGPTGALRYLSPRYLLPITALILIVTGSIYWQNLQNNDEVADIDAKLLSGDLPIDAYLDKGLDSWLKRTSY
jgi:hypothetical protein